MDWSSTLMTTKFLLSHADIFGLVHTMTCGLVLLSEGEICVTQLIYKTTRTDTYCRAGLVKETGFWSYIFSQYFIFSCVLIVFTYGMDAVLLQLFLLSDFSTHLNPAMTVCTGKCCNLN